jgi:hypothetical protein
MAEDYSLDAAEFRCLVPFPDASDSFVHGFEAGMIWQRMVRGEQEIGGISEVATHSANAEVFQRMADAQGYDLHIDDSADGWMIATFVKRKNRFRVVPPTPSTKGPDDE